MAQYNVVLLDRDGFDIVNDLVDGLPAAKKTANYLLSADFAKTVESTHETLGTTKVEVRNESGECIWDREA